MEMEKVKKELMHMFHAWRILLGSLVKWILLSIVIGGVIGVIASAFANLHHVGKAGLSYGAYVDGISAAFCRSHDCFSLSCYGAREECRNRYGAYGSTVRSEYDAGKSGTIDFVADSLTLVWRFCRPGRCRTSVWGKPRKLAGT